MLIYPDASSSGSRLQNNASSYLLFVTETVDEVVALSNGAFHKFTDNETKVEFALNEQYIVQVRKYGILTRFFLKGLSGPITVTDPFSTVSAALADCTFATSGGLSGAGDATCIQKIYQPSHGFLDDTYQVVYDSTATEYGLLVGTNDAFSASGIVVDSIHQDTFRMVTCGFIVDSLGLASGEYFQNDTTTYGYSTDSDTAYLAVMVDKGNYIRVFPPTATIAGPSNHRNIYNTDSIINEVRNVDLTGSGRIDIDLNSSAGTPKVGLRVHTAYDSDDVVNTFLRGVTPVDSITIENFDGGSRILGATSLLLRGATGTTLGLSGQSTFLRTRINDGAGNGTFLQKRTGGDIQYSEYGLPRIDGTANQVLKYDAAGDSLVWAADDAGASLWTDAGTYIEPTSLSAQLNDNGYLKLINLTAGGDAYKAAIGGEVDATRYGRIYFQGNGGCCIQQMVIAATHQDGGLYFKGAVSGTPTETDWGRIFRGRWQFGNHGGIGGSVLGSTAMIGPNNGSGTTNNILSIHNNTNDLVFASNSKFSINHDQVSYNFGINGNTIADIFITDVANDKITINGDFEVSGGTGSVWRGNTSTEASDGSGDVTFSHGAPFTPDHVIVTASGGTGEPYVYVVDDSSITATEVTMRVYNITLGTAVTSASNLNFQWTVAIKN